MTFADLMSLLMCFFVLLLSFSEMDLEKYKQVAGSMKFAFGVQREVKADDVPKGTSIIAQEFSAGRPVPTVINEVRQQTTDDMKQTLEFTDAYVEEQQTDHDVEDSSPESESRLQAADGNAALEAKTVADAEQLLAALADEIAEGMIQVETEGSSIRIRIREKGSFPSGQAMLKGGFLPVLRKLQQALEDVEGQVVVAGHTDNLPISTERFRSNWELSAGRAVTVVHELLAGSALEPERFMVEGHGDAHPLVPNDSAANRALNRRVEMTIIQGRKGWDPAAIEQDAGSLGPGAAGPAGAAGEGQAAGVETIEIIEPIGPETNERG